MILINLYYYINIPVHKTSCGQEKNIRYLYLLWYFCFLHGKDIIPASKIIYMCVCVYGYTILNLSFVRQVFISIFVRNRYIDLERDKRDWTWEGESGTWTSNERCLMNANHSVLMIINVLFIVPTSHLTMTNTNRIWCFTLYRH